MRNLLSTSAAAGWLLLGVTLCTLSACGTAPDTGTGTATPQTAAGPTAPPPLSYVAPELRGALVPMQELLKGREMYGFSMEEIPAVRERAALYQNRPYLEAPAVDEVVIPGLPGEPDVKVYVVNSHKHITRPVIVYMHGGGFVIGKASEDIPRLQALALKHDCVFVSVDYRLAPETAFPGSLHDNYAALKWVYDQADELGVDRSRIAIMGDSAGGGHAAMLALAARDRGEVPIKRQILIYPMLDDRTGSTVAAPYWRGYLSWTPASNRTGWTALLGVPAGSEEVPYGAVPARVQDLAGLPPAFIIVGSVDLFVDENIDYARRLMHAGIETELIVLPGGYHGFQVGNPDTVLARRFHAAVDAAITLAFAVEGNE